MWEFSSDCFRRSAAVRGLEGGSVGMLNKKENYKE